MTGAFKERQRASLLLIAVAGALAGHVIGYGMVGTTFGSLHDYLGPTATVILPFAAAAIGLFGWRLARGLGVDLASEQRRLTTMMVSVYALQEVGERLVAGHRPSLAEVLPVLLGLLMQPVVAWILVLLASLVGRVIEAWTHPRLASFTDPAPLLIPARVQSPTGRRVRRSRTSRGPPRS